MLLGSSFDHRGFILLSDTEPEFVLCSVILELLEKMRLFPRIVTQPCVESFPIILLITFVCCFTSLQDFSSYNSLGQSQFSQYYTLPPSYVPAGLPNSDDHSGGAGVAGYSAVKSEEAASAGLPPRGFWLFIIFCLFSAFGFFTLNNCQHFVLQHIVNSCVTLTHIAVPTFKAGKSTVRILKPKRLMVLSFSKLTLHK